MAPAERLLALSGALDNTSRLNEIVSGYLGLMETVMETYVILKEPGFIGRRKAAIKNLRNTLYS